MTLIGIYYVLATWPIWAIAGALYLLTDGLIHWGRERFEGIPYQVAHSAKFGDAGILIAVLIAATILQRGNVIIPEWLLDIRWHLTILLVSLGIGTIVSVATLGKRSGQWMDIYHDVVIGPMILYCAITLLPVIYLNGTQIEQGATAVFILAWAALVFYDIKAMRMDQRSWLKAHGVTFRS